MSIIILKEDILLVNSGHYVIKSIWYCIYETKNWFGKTGDWVKWRVKTNQTAMIEEGEM